MILRQNIRSDFRLTLLVQSRFKGLELGMQFRISPNQQFCSRWWFKRLGKHFNVFNKLDKGDSSVILAVRDGQEAHVADGRRQGLGFRATFYDFCHV